MRHGLLIFEDSVAGLQACRRRVAGLSLLDRGVRTMVRAGIERLFVIVPEAAATALPGVTRRLPAQVRFLRWSNLAGLQLPADEHVLVLFGQYVHHHSSLADFQAAGDRTEEVVAMALPAAAAAPGDWRVTVAGGTVALGPEPDGQAPVCAGAFACRGRVLDPQRLAAAGANLRALLDTAVTARQATVWLSPSRRWRRVTDRQSARAAKAMLFDQVTKPTSGFISRHLNARASIPISKLLVETGMSPHLITVAFVLTTGLAAAWFISMPELYWHTALAGALWQLAAILDRCDGEVARVRLCESAFGAWFDTVTDNFSYLCGYGALIVGMRRLHPEALWAVAPGITAILALVATLGILYAYARRTGSGSLQHYLRDLSHNVAEVDKTIVQRLMQRYGFVAKRDFLSLALCVVLLAGQTEVAYGLLVLLLHLAALAVLLSQRTMLRSAAAQAAGAPR